MKKISVLFAILALFAINAFADIRLPDTPKPKPSNRRAIPWKLREIPLVSNNQTLAKIVFASLAISVVVVVVTAFWLGLAADYATTRDVYFAFAIAHVLAEFPFLIKML